MLFNAYKIFDETFIETSLIGLILRHIMLTQPSHISQMAFFLSFFEKPDFYFTWKSWYYSPNLTRTPERKRKESYKLVRKLLAPSLHRRRWPELEPWNRPPSMQWKVGLVAILNSTSTSTCLENVKWPGQITSPSTKESGASAKNTISVDDRITPNGRWTIQWEQRTNPIPHVGTHTSR